MKTTIATFAPNAIYSVKQQNLKNETSEVQKNLNGNYNPHSYRPISFGARLFRTPENFYEQQFNMEGMPETMRKYLMEDFSDRRHMPPSQMMALVFDDINLAKDVEQAKRLYPDEPLFKNLKNPSNKARTNIVAGLQALQDGSETEKLFKNGDNDLGIYILKKIYIEGKTLKEINKDFKSEANPIFAELLPEINYDTLSKYGIKYPKQGFWHSFYSNRENFPYTYTPRKGIGSNIGGNFGERTIKNPAEKAELPQKRKYTMSQRDIDRISESILKGEGNAVNTKRALKNSNINRENYNFLFKYMSPIMSVSADRINLSERLEEFYRTNGYGEIASTDLTNLTHKQGTALKEFWKLNPALREHFSNAIKDTIELFTEEYGENGENPRFKQLLKFAENIKPERERLKMEHLEKQKYYEEIFKPIAEEVKPNQEEIKRGEKLLADISKEIEELSEIIKNPEAYRAKYAPITWEQLIDSSIGFKYLPENFTSAYKQMFLRKEYAKEGNKLIQIDPDITTNQKLNDLVTKIAKDSKIKYLKHDIAAKLILYKYYRNYIDDLNDILYVDVQDAEKVIEKKLGNHVPKPEFMQELNRAYRWLTTPGNSSKKEMDGILNEFTKLIFGYGLKDNAINLPMDNPTVKTAMKNARDQLVYSGLYKEYEQYIRVATDPRADKVIVKFICDAMLQIMKELR